MEMSVLTTFAPSPLATLGQLLGGVGLFLIGMILMSDGLKSAAGTALQTVLERFTGNRITAFLSGVGLTALVQSSSATTITTIGFVSAGLLSFSAAIGVILGANVGTTSTGWIVSLLGFKLNVAAFALPFIGIGALLRLLSDGRRAHFGMALAGFGLIFVGIDFLQQGMGGLADRLDLSVFEVTTTGGRLLLVLVGAIMTVLLQSSSAAVAMTLTALHSGAIGLEQAALLVIGQNLGTTVKAILAAIGASVPAQRTAVAHILFNVVTAGLTFLAVRPLLSLSETLAGAGGRPDPAVEIAIFHTIFNLMGVALFLPITGPFARFVTRLVPERGPILTRHLDSSVLRIPAVAVEAAARALREISALTLAEATTLLAGDQLNRQGQERLWTAQSAMVETRAFVGKIPAVEHESDLYGRRLALLHAGDHIDRLVEACLEAECPVQGQEAQAAAMRLLPEMENAIAWLRQGQEKGRDLVEHVKRASKRQAKSRRKHRAWLLEETAAGRTSPGQAHRELESMRWVDRVAYHTWRALRHLAHLPLTDADSASEVYAEDEAGD
jgi:phosphate:Na+ symporter